MVLFLKQYPDITAILRQKFIGRRKRAGLSFAEKIDLLDQLRKRAEPIKQARQARLKTPND